MPTIEETHSKVQRLLLAKFGRVELDKNNNFIVQHESAVVFVRVSEGFDDDGTMVQFDCPLVTGVEITNELCFWIATEGSKYRLGSVCLTPDSDGGHGLVTFEYSIVSDDLDESELIHGLFAVVYTANKLDNEVQNMFGGELFGSEP